MEPSALPAFSAPSGVSSAPSFAASAADTAAMAGRAERDSRDVATMNRSFLNMVIPLVAVRTRT